MTVDWTDILRQTKRDLVHAWETRPQNMDELRSRCEALYATADAHRQAYPMVWLSYGIGAVSLGGLAFAARMSLSRAERALRQSQHGGPRVREHHLRSSSSSVGYAKGAKYDVKEELAQESTQYPDIALPGKPSSPSSSSSSS